MVKGGYLLVFVSVFLYMSCKSTQNVEKLPTELQLEVTYGDNLKPTGAVVSVFKDKGSYLQSSPTYSLSGAVAVDSTQNGICTISTLNSSDKYIISVHYKDYKSYPGFYIDYDNNSVSYTVLNLLLDGSQTKASVKLKPANGLVTFWTTADNSMKLPLKIAFPGNIFDSVSHTIAGNPIPNDPGVTTMKIKNGNYNYYVESKTGCAYNGNINIQGADLHVVKLDACNTGRLAFWTMNNSDLPITVIVNENDTLGTIYSVVASSPADCSAPNILLSDLLPGQYPYTAVSNTSKLVWTGKITLGKDDCQLIQIK